MLMIKKELLARARAIPVLLQVGKNGVSDAFLDELKLLVKKKGMIKVRFLKSFSDVNDTKTVAAETATKASLLVVNVVGNTAVFTLAPK